MKEIRLIKLQLDNFKGIKYLMIEFPNGENLSVYGDNGTGKTTIADAFSWLLFNKDTAGRSDFEIKTLSSDGKPINYLDHSVYAELNVDGEIVSLQKIFREKWVKQRGSIEREFQGHETEYRVNSIPKSKGDYTSFIKSLVDEEIFKLITNPIYFNTAIDKKKRREILFNLFASVSDNDVIASNSDLLGELEPMLKKYSVDELRTLTASNKRRINADLQAIPNRIDEASRFIVPINESEEDKFRKELNDLTEELSKKNAELQSLNSSVVENKRKQEILEDINAFRTEAEIKKNEIYKQATEEHSYKLKVLDKLKDIESNIRSIDLDRNSYDLEIRELEGRIDEIRKEWQEEFSKNYEGDNICPTCKQPLPEEMVMQAIESFNKKKSERLERINTYGQFLRDRLDKLKKIKEEEEKRYNASVEILKVLEEKKDESNKLVHAAEKRYTDKVDEYNAYIKSVEEIILSKQNELTIAETDTEATKAIEESKNTIRSQISEIEANRAVIEQNIKAIESNAKIRERVSELESEAKRLTTEYEKNEKQDYLVGEFVKLKAKMLEDNINSRFKFAKFKLFEQQINGGIVDTCEVVYDGVPYSVLNNAMRINIGLDIINAFCEHYQVYAPVVVDNAESVTKLFETKSQQIKLYVSEADKTLRFENK